MYIYVCIKLISERYWVDCVMWVKCRVRIVVLNHLSLKPMIVEYRFSTFSINDKLSLALFYFNNENILLFLIRQLNNIISIHTTINSLKNIKSIQNHKHFTTSIVSSLKDTHNANEITIHTK